MHYEVEANTALAAVTEHFSIVEYRTEDPLDEVQALDAAFFSSKTRSVVASTGQYARLHSSQDVMRTLGAVF